MMTHKKINKRAEYFIMLPTASITLSHSLFLSWFIFRFDGLITIVFVATFCFGFTAEVRNYSNNNNNNNVPNTVNLYQRLEPV